VHDRPPGFSRILPILCLKPGRPDWVLTVGAAPKAAPRTLPTHGQYHQHAPGGSDQARPGADGRPKETGRRPAERGLGWQFEPKVGNGFRLSRLFPLRAAKAGRAQLQSRGKAAEPLLFPEIVAMLGGASRQDDWVAGRRADHPRIKRLSLSFQALQGAAPSRREPGGASSGDPKTPGPVHGWFDCLQRPRPIPRCTTEPLPPPPRPPLAEIPARRPMKAALPLSPCTFDPAGGRRAGGREGERRAARSTGGLSPSGSTDPTRRAKRSMLKVKQRPHRRLRRRPGFRYDKTGPPRSPRSCSGCTTRAGPAQTMSAFTSSIARQPISRPLTRPRLERLIEPPGLQPGRAPRRDPSRWNPGGLDRIGSRCVPSLVCRGWSMIRSPGETLSPRHRFLRWRPDKRPDQMAGMDQLQYELRPRRAGSS